MSTVCVILSLVIGSIQLLNSHGLRLLPPEELDTSAIGEYKAFFKTDNRVLFLVSKFHCNSTDANKFCQQMKMNIKVNWNIRNDVYKALWGDNQTDKFWVDKKSCGGNDQCAAVSQSTKYCDEDCTRRHKFLCRARVYKLLLVHNGHLGFHFNDTWIPLCFPVNFTQQENSEICDKTYTLHRNKYKYDDVGIGCNNQTELHVVSCPDVVHSVKFFPHLIKVDGDVLLDQSVKNRPIAVVPKYVEVNESDVVVLQCNVSSNPQSNVIWTGPNGKEESTETTLNFGEIGRAAIGNYTCRATNKIGNDSVTVEIFINAPPKINLFLHSVTDQNQSVIMRCAATGIPTPEITWSKDSILVVTNSSKYSIASMISPTNQYLVLSTLTVFNVGESDVMGHTCSIENKNGKTQKTFRIRRKLKCRCLSRYLKNRVPLNYTQDELQQEIDKTREELVVKNPTQKLIKKISASDKRTSAKYIGAIGVVVIAGVLTLIIVSDVLGCFYNVKGKVKLKKNKVKPEQKHL